MDTSSESRIDGFASEVGERLAAAGVDRDHVEHHVEGLRAYLAEAARSGELDQRMTGLGSAEQVAERMRNPPARHHHLDPVVLPDGTTIWATSYAPDYARDRSPDFGLYLDARWSPPWPHGHIDWPDFSVPVDRDAMLGALRDALARAREGEVVEVGCLGGHGRTGTAVACLAVLAGLETDAVDWVRSTYCDHAVETDEQVALVRGLQNAP
jgi:hypothetical protein